MTSSSWLESPCTSTYWVIIAVPEPQKYAVLGFRVYLNSNTMKNNGLLGFFSGILGHCLARVGGFRYLLADTKKKPESPWHKSSFGFDGVRETLNPMHPHISMYIPIYSIPICPHISLRPKPLPSLFWVAVKEFKLSYYIGETLLFTIYTHYGNPKP